MTPVQWLAVGDDRDDTDLGSATAPPRRRWALRLAVVVAALLLAAVVALVVTVSPEESVAYPEGFRWEQHELDQGLVTRRWTVGIPEGLGPGPHPAVVALHPLGFDRAAWASETDLARFAREQGVVVVLPQGLWGMWNAGQCCGPSGALGVDDVGFLEGVMRRTADRPDVDPAAVHMVGLSNGALMVFRYLCDATVAPARAAAVAAIPWDLDGCDGSVPLLVSTGTADEVFPMEGGRTAANTLASGRASRPWSDARAELVQRWGCADGEEETTVSAWSRPGEATTDWRRAEPEGCRSPLTLTVVEGVPHTWLWGGEWSHTHEVLRFLGLEGDS
jgi:poly(3-hydroxybutyrate) depolymerase